MAGAVPPLTFQSSPMHREQPPILLVPAQPGEEGGGGGGMRASMGATNAAGGGGAQVFITEPLLKIEDEPDESLDALKAAVAGTTEANQATLLLRKRKDMRMVEDSLEAVKREFKDRMEGLAERQLKFEEKQRALQEMVTKFKPFIEENDAKRARAAAKSTAEAGARVRLEGEAEKATLELAQIRAERERISQDIQRFQRHYEYLNDVVKLTSTGLVGITESFANPNDLLARYKMLRDTNVDLHKQATAAAAEVEKLRTDVSAVEKRMRDMALVSTSGAQELRGHLEQARAKVVDLVSQRDFSEATERQKIAAAGQTESSIRNVYARVVATAPLNSLPRVVLDKSKPNGHFEYLLEALEVIADRMEDLEAIKEEYGPWKEQVAREKEAAARSRLASAAGSGAAAARAVREDGGGAASNLSLPRGTSASTTSLQHVSSSRRLGANSSQGMRFSGLDPGQSKFLASQIAPPGVAAPSTTPGVYVMKIALPVAPTPGGASTHTVTGSYPALPGSGNTGSKLGSGPSMTSVYGSVVSPLDSVRSGRR